MCKVSHCVNRIAFTSTQLYQIFTLSSPPSTTSSKGCCFGVRFGCKIDKQSYIHIHYKTNLSKTGTWRALLTRNACNIGKLNYYLGARAAREGRKSLYPSIDFCVDLEATCELTLPQYTCIDLAIQFSWPVHINMA